MRVCACEVSMFDITQRSKREGECFYDRDASDDDDAGLACTVVPVMEISARIVHTYNKGRLDDVEND